jgi:hypothetical protein
MRVGAVLPRRGYVGDASIAYAHSQVAKELIMMTLPVRDR